MYILKSFESVYLALNFIILNPNWLLKNILNHLLGSHKANIQGKLLLK